MPRSTSGEQYLLTIMCASSRFPGAIPLSYIRAPAICEALQSFFLKFGLAESIRSDQGSNFQSKKFRQFLKELGIKQYKSSVWLPESQGALERFHRHLKLCLRHIVMIMKKTGMLGYPYSCSLYVIVYRNH